MNSIEKHISRRIECPLCHSRQLGEPVAPHIERNFPLLPVCVDQPLESDLFAPFTICLCKGCGLILLRDVVDPAILYEIFHSDGIGAVWNEHYEKLASLIRKYHRGGRVAEIGAGQGKLIRKLLPHYQSGVEVIDPQYEGPRDGIVVHDRLMDAQFAESLAGQFDSLVSSHTLEHFVEFDDYFKGARTCLRQGGLLFTSVPNQEAGFAKGYGNMLNFEHPAICTNLHWLYLHYRNGFAVKHVSLFRSHSVMFVAEKSDSVPPFELDAIEMSTTLLAEFGASIQDRIARVRKHATPDRENWLFGASNFSQPLFMYGLDEALFAGVMDNSPLKHDKRLYGTRLVCRRPADVVSAGKPLRVFLNVASYNGEVRTQLEAFNSPGLELVEL
jgi:SAM-dependent methyltransferase